jgi:glucosamine-6-phosphate deaminase
LLQLCRYDSPATWTDAIVALWCDRLKANPRLRMCLPAGRTPQPIYAGIAHAVAARRCSFAAAKIFLLDEYGGLARDDPRRCTQMLRRDLLSRVDLPPRQFAALDPDAADMDAMCGDTERRIAAGGLQLTLLGIGLNGHVGLNEPGTAADSRTRRVDLAPATVQTAASYPGDGSAPLWGVTLGVATLAQSEEIWLLACGAAKAAIVGRIVHGAAGSEVPATLLRSHPNCRLFVDRAAAAAV